MQDTNVPNTWVAPPSSQDTFICAQSLEALSTNNNPRPSTTRYFAPVTSHQTLPSLSALGLAPFPMNMNISQRLGFPMESQQQYPIRYAQNQYYAETPQMHPISRPIPVMPPFWEGQTNAMQQTYPPNVYSTMNPLYNVPNKTTAVHDPRFVTTRNPFPWQQQTTTFQRPQNSLFGALSNAKQVPMPQRHSIFTSPPRTKTKNMTPSHRKRERISARRRADPELPKRARTPYLYFMMTERKKIAAEFPTSSFGEISHIMGERYHNLTPEKRQYYENLAKEDQDRFEKECIEYRTKYPGSAHLVSSFIAHVD